MKNLIYTLTAAVLLAASPVKAQNTENASSEYIPKNFIKTNLTGILFRNYTLQYERVITRRFSVGLEYRFMPKGALPLSKTLNKYIKDADGGVTENDFLTGFQISSTAFTPSVRFYPTRKGYGRGFYFNAFYRLVNYDMSIPKFEYDTDQSVELTGQFKTNTYGFTIGKQWTIGKFIVIDYTIFGLQYGSASGTLTADHTATLDADDQAALEQSLNDVDFDVPLVDIKTSSDVGPNQSRLNVTAKPWAGFRTGVAIGIRF